MLINGYFSISCSASTACANLKIWLIQDSNFTFTETDQFMSNGTDLKQVQCQRSANFDKRFSADKIKNHSQENKIWYWSLEWAKVWNALSWNELYQLKLQPISMKTRKDFQLPKKFRRILADANSNWLST